MAQDKVNIPAPDSSNSNRRGFIGSAIAVFAGIAARLRRAPVACVACGSSSHVTSLCPSNNAAMGGFGSIEVYGSDGRMKGAAKILGVDPRGMVMALSTVVDSRSGDYIVEYASDGSPIRTEF